MKQAFAQVCAVAHDLVRLEERREGVINAWLSLLLVRFHVLGQTNVLVINFSLYAGYFSSVSAHAIVNPLLRKHSVELDEQIMSKIL